MNDRLNNVQLVTHKLFGVKTRMIESAPCVPQLKGELIRARNDEHLD